MKYFIADLHLYHENIIRFCERPFANVEEMNAALIRNWNQVVTQKDEVYILGDFIVRGSGEQANEVLHQLNGKKYLIKGNHEHYLKAPDFDTSLFESINDYAEISYNKRKFVLFHYPILEWSGYYRESIHLYGHVHNSKVSYFNELLGPRAVNVGADLIDFKPISIDEIIELVAERVKLQEG